MIITIFEYMILNCLAVIGFHYAAQEGMILGFIRTINFSKWIAMPLYDCPTCMASIHSFYIFIPLNLFFDVPLILWPVYVLALAGMNTMVDAFIFALHALTNFLKDNG